MSTLFSIATRESLVPVSVSPVQSTRQSTRDAAIKLFVVPIYFFSFKSFLASSMSSVKARSFLSIFAASIAASKVFLFLDANTRG